MTIILTVFSYLFRVCEHKRENGGNDFIKKKNTKD